MKTPNKLETLLACIPESPFKTHLVAEVERKDEAIKLAVEALEQSNRFVWHYANSEPTTAVAERCDAAIKLLREVQG